MTDIVKVHLKITRSALDLLVACANIGVEGADGNLADIDDVTNLLDELEPFVNTSPNDEITIDQTTDLGDCNWSPCPHEGTKPSGITGRNLGEILS